MCRKWSEHPGVTVLSQKKKTICLNALKEGVLCSVLSLVYLDLFFDSKRDICASDITF